jgi:hypothetical protein
MLDATQWARNEFAVAIADCYNKLVNASGSELTEDDVDILKKERNRILRFMRLKLTKTGLKKRTKQKRRRSEMVAPPQPEPVQSTIPILPRPRRGQIQQSA